MDLIPFLSAEQVRHIQSTYGTPVYVYDQQTLEDQADRVLDFPNAFGLIARYAMKACPSAAVLRVLVSGRQLAPAALDHRQMRSPCARDEPPGRGHQPMRSTCASGCLLRRVRRTW